jgi:hypothetical protein
MKILSICFFALLFFSNPIFSETKIETTWSDYGHWSEGIAPTAVTSDKKDEKVYICLDYASSPPWVLYRAPSIKKGERVCEGNTFGPVEWK